jgi:hypothetical protein
MGGEPLEITKHLPCDGVGTQLQRILADPAFSASALNRKFLSYVVSETLAGRGGRKERASRNAMKLIRKLRWIDDEEGAMQLERTPALPLDDRRVDEISAPVKCCCTELSFVARA